VSAIRRFLATKLEENYNDNEKLLGELYRLFSVAVAALGADVFLWTIKLA
jgi:hypothetical protein